MLFHHLRIKSFPCCRVSFGGLFVVMLMIATASGQESDDRKTPAAEPSTPQPDVTPDPSVAEIESIRKRFGGGVAERLQGVAPGVDTDQAFRRSLQRMVENAQPPALMKPNKSHASGSAQPNAPRPDDRRQHHEGHQQRRLHGDVHPRQWRHDMPLPFHQNRHVLPGPRQESQETLRETAAELEHLAANMEENKLYEQADRLRATASEFWQQARRFD